MIASYTDLQAKIASWLRRTDLTDVIPDFIALAETEINRRVYLTYYEVRARANLNGEFLPLPADCNVVKSVSLLTSPVKVLDYLSPRVLAKRGIYYDSPTHYTILADQFRFWPISTDTSQVIEILYSQNIPVLSATVATNEVLKRHPDLYLSAALQHGYAYIKDFDKATGASASKEQIISQINAQDDELTYGGASLTIRVK